MPQRTDPPKPSAPLAYELTPEEIEDLRRESREASEYAAKVFAHLNRDTPVKGLKGRRHG